MSLYIISYWCGNLRKGSHVICVLRLDSFNFILWVKELGEVVARKLPCEWFSRYVSVSNLLSYFTFDLDELLFFRGKFSYLLFIHWADDMILAFPPQGVRRSHLDWPYRVVGSRHSPKAWAADPFCRNLHVHSHPLHLLQTPQCSEFGVCVVGWGPRVTNYKCTCHVLITKA